MPPTILMLEDDADRLRRFAAVLAQVAPQCHFRHWRDAHAMIRECPPLLPGARLICLDHDLEPFPGCDDAGDGLSVARVLAALKPTCPILIHTSNADGARRMQGEFEFESIATHALLPFGPDWIERHWRQRVETLLQSSP